MSVRPACVLCTLGAHRGQKRALTGPESVKREACPPLPPSLSCDKWWVFYLHVCLYICVQCPQKQEEGIGSSRTVMTDFLSVLGIEPRFSKKNSHYSQPLNQCFSATTCALNYYFFWCFERGLTMETKLTLNLDLPPQW